MYTKEERRAIYEEVLELLLVEQSQMNITVGLCQLLKIVLKSKMSSQDAAIQIASMSLYYPELDNYRPYDIFSAAVPYYWWRAEDFESRIYTLRRCIAETM